MWIQCNRHLSPLPNLDAILDYIWCQHPNGMLDYSLTVKVGGIYHLLRNFSIDLGLVKNVWVEVVGIGSKLITICMLQHSQTSGINPDNILLLHITFKERLHSGHTLCHQQFPLTPTYASTFHSCQDLTLDCVRVDLTQDVFTHGQLYTTLLRIRHHHDAIVRLCSLENLTTKNVTYKELLIWGLLSNL